MYKGFFDGVKVAEASDWVVLVSKMMQWKVRNRKEEWSTEWHGYELHYYSRGYKK